MGRYVSGDAPAADEMVAQAVKGIGEEIDRLGIEGLEGVVLGGGYGRGEGGAYVGASAASRSPLSNDLDFFVIAAENSTKAQRAAMSEALGGVSREWSDKLGIDVDFCTPKTPGRMKRDGGYLMIQELLHGYADVAGEKGETMFAAIERIDSGRLPVSEAARLLMNRGAGLLLARDAMAGGAEGDFVPRNINKCVLGAFDARLIIKGQYKWRQKERVATLGETLYAAAAEWKSRPRPEPVCDWRTAKEEWFKTWEMLPPRLGIQPPITMFTLLGRLALKMIAGRMNSEQGAFVGSPAHRLWKRLS